MDTTRNHWIGTARRGIGVLAVAGVMAIGLQGGASADSRPPGWDNHEDYPPRLEQPGMNAPLPLMPWPMPEPGREFMPPPGPGR